MKQFEKTSSTDYDIVIIGGGPAGLSFACSLRHTGLRIAIIEKQPIEALANPLFDGRDIALAHGSMRILKQLSTWSSLADDEISPIKEARVINGTSPYSLTFDTSRDDIPALGFLVSNHDIRRTLFEKAQEISNLEIVTGKSVVAVNTADRQASLGLDDGTNLKAALLVAADSRFSETRRMVGIPASMHDFGRVCIVCRMEHEKPHGGIAYECFHYGRTLAILPLNGNQSTIVVTAPMSDQDQIMNAVEAEFNEDIQARFKGRYGRMSLCTDRFAYPLVGVHARKFCATRFALIGDAAVGMHPVTAHGFNLGLSGQDLLATEIINATGDIGDERLLRRYEWQHMLATKPMYHGTNQIVQMFTDDRIAARIMRRLTLRMANNFSPIKRIIRNKLTESHQSRGLF